MKNTGIWIDKEKAHIVTVSGESEDMKTIPFETITSQFGDLQKHGGASEIIKDRRVLEREKHRTKQYFNTLISELDGAKALIVIGPAQMGLQFVKLIKQDFPELGKKVKEVIKSDKMTANQLKALVREFFMSTS